MMVMSHLRSSNFANRIRSRRGAGPCQLLEALEQGRESQETLLFPQPLSSSSERSSPDLRCWQTRGMFRTSRARLLDVSEESWIDTESTDHTKQHLHATFRQRQHVSL